MEQPNENPSVFGIRVIPVESVQTAFIATSTPWGVEIVSLDGRHDFISHEQIARITDRIRNRMLAEIEERLLFPGMKNCTPETKESDQ